MSVKKVKELKRGHAVTCVPSLLAARGLAPRIVALVKAEEVDFGIGSIDNTDPDVHVTPLIADGMRVVFPSGHALEKKKVISLKDLAGLPLIEMEPERCGRRLVDRAFESIGQVAAPDYETSFVGTAIGMVKAGLGIAILSSLAVEAAAVPGVATRIITWPGLIRNIRIMRKSGARFRLRPTAS